MSRLPEQLTRSKRQVQLERMDYAQQAIIAAGFDLHFQNKVEIRFFYKGNEIKIFPYTGWFTGKGIKDGRGIHNLLKQLK